MFSLCQEGMSAFFLFFSSYEKINVTLLFPWYTRVCVWERERDQVYVCVCTCLCALLFISKTKDEMHSGVLHTLKSNNYIYAMYTDYVKGTSLPLWLTGLKAPTN